VHVSPYHLEHVRLSEETRCLLAEVGLPRKYHIFHFDILQYGLLYYPEVIQQEYKLTSGMQLASAQKMGNPEEYERLRVLGYTDPFSMICLDEEQEGAILCTDVASWPLNPPLMFVNSSLLQFVECMIIECNWQDYYKKYLGPFPLWGEMDANGIIEVLRAEFHQVDPAAVAAESTLWNEFVLHKFNGA
jgi:hypothetical protein